MRVGARGGERVRGGVRVRGGERVRVSGGESVEVGWGGVGRVWRWGWGGVGVRWGGEEDIKCEE